MTNTLIGRLLSLLFGFLPNLWKMIVYTLGFRYLTENLIQDLVSLAIDAQTSDTQRHLSEADLIIMLFSSFMILLKLILILTIVLKSSSPNS